MSIPECKQEQSKEKVNRALGKVNDAFKRALQNATSSLSTSVPTLTSAPPIPTVEYVIAIMTQTTKDVLNEEMTAEFDSKGWSGREELHQKLVNETIDRLENYTR